MVTSRPLVATNRIHGGKYKEPNISNEVVTKSECQTRYVINNSRVISKPGVSVKPESVLLGRAWRDHARVVFQNTELSDIIDPVGWSPWGATDPSNIYYAEFNNSGLGSDTFGRVEWSYQLNTPVIMDEIMPGWQNWVDIEYWG